MLYQSSYFKDKNHQKIRKMEKNQNFKIGRCGKGTGK